MKVKQVKELLKKKSVRIAGAVLAIAVAFGGIWAANDQATTVPELVSYVDTEDVTTISEEEVPLSNTQVTTSTKTKKKTKKVKLDEKATKTYTSKGKTTTKTSTKTKTTASAKTTIKTTVKTQTTSKYTKGSRICKRTTTTKTTVTKTVVTSSGSSALTAAETSAASAASTDSSADTSGTSASSTTGTTIEVLAPKVDSRVSSAWNTLRFSFTIDSSVSYSGYFNAKSQSITLKTANNTVYHELGHFLAFIAGNADTSSSFVSVYNSEKDLVTAYNKSYVTQDSSEYFAESFKEYTLDAASLKASRPQTYAAIEAALEKVTTAQVTKIAAVYASVWS